MTEAKVKLEMAYKTITKMEAEKNKAEALIKEIWSVVEDPKLWSPELEDVRGLIIDSEGGDSKNNTHNIKWSEE